MERTKKLDEIRFFSRTDQLNRVRHMVRKTAGSKGFDPKVVNCIVLAVDEACTNVIRHAYGRGCPGEIILEILASPDELIFRLTDFADPVDKSVIQPRDPDNIRPGGLGVYLIHKVMDKVEFLEPLQGVGNVLEMRKKLTHR